MKKYIVPYSSESTTAGVAFYEVNDYEELIPLVIKDFFSYDTTNEAGEDVLVSDLVLADYKETDDFYDVCSNYGIYFGEPVDLEEALKYVCTKEDYK